MDLSTEAVCTNLEKKKWIKNREMKAGKKCCYQAH